MAERYSLLPVGTGNPYPENTARHAAYEEGRASLTVSAGSEPVAAITALWEAIGYQGAHTASTGNLAPTQKLIDAVNAVEALTTHPSPPEGMVGGWMPIETAPVAGLILLTVEDSAGERRVFPAEASHENGGWVWQVTLGWLGWTRLHSGWTPILWRRLPPPPTSSADSRKGE